MLRGQGFSVYHGRYTDAEQVSFGYALGLFLTITMAAILMPSSRSLQGRHSHSEQLVSKET